LRRWWFALQAENCTYAGVALASRVAVGAETLDAVRLGHDLAKQRDDLVKLFEGLTDTEARSTPTASTLSLLGLLKHLALWERRWFQTVVTGRVTPGDWPDSDDDWTAADFTLADHDTIDQWLDRHRAEVSISIQIVAAAGLDDFCRLPASPAATFDRWCST
jgi:hypothetical protein